ncbi:MULTISPECIES: tetratricopeptide repeat protein [unclassified Paenibacillus]|uniref:tetratricopeptide repeat protein n=1 Tax=unclassified Paenibacillus TaxID=185978 RepID=UPI001049B2C2|nr:MULTISPECIES: tetratricopeptide repeat protein [unclassified Paenibacillus]NIK71718.1 tetratricopeptide (TPR) repeat protein [Paenibacillus sp. BK720]
MNELEIAVQLRESGQLEESRLMLLALVERYPANPSVCYQCAWVHDTMGLEREAVPYYQKSIELGLSGEDRQGAYLGWGSTCRTLGMYAEAQSVFREAISEYPDNREFQVFYAMVLYNLREHGAAMEILLKQLAETSQDEGIQSYRKALLFYADKLDQRWD